MARLKSGTKAEEAPPPPISASLSTPAVAANKRAAEAVGGTPKSKLIKMLSPALQSRAQLLQDDDDSDDE